MTGGLPDVAGVRAQRQLGLIADIVELATEAGIQVWLRGGWSMDLFLGDVTRDHVDIDWFAWSHDAEPLRDRLLARGWRLTGGWPLAQQLDVTKDGEEASFAWLARDASGRVVVGGGPWAGKPYPDGMLDAEPGRLGSVVCPIISPAAQIEIKQMMPVWVPDRPRRAKDAADVARLQAAVRRAGAGPS